MLRAVRERDGREEGNVRRRRGGGYKVDVTAGHGQRVVYFFISYLTVPKAQIS